LQSPYRISRVKAPPYSGENPGATINALSQLATRRGSFNAALTHECVKHHIPKLFYSRSTSIDKFSKINFVLMYYQNGRKKKRAQFTAMIRDLSNSNYVLFMLPAERIIQGRRLATMANLCRNFFNPASTERSPWPHKALLESNKSCQNMLKSRHDLAKANLNR
jgi:hypothetical protein